MKKTIAGSMIAITAAAMVVESLTACGGSDDKTEFTTAVETTVGVSESVEETTAEAADAEETIEAIDVEESTEAVDTEEFTEAADIEESTEAVDAKESTEASKEEAISEANAEVVEKTTEATRN